MAKKKTTNTTIIGINLPSKLATELNRRAKSMSISKSSYCKLVLQQWVDSGSKLTLSE